ncbi:MAG: hypothetical protein DRH32_05400 [Deltaproteobacteria bacterium]|nr:MAG: hypothetical protein DRH32_05400 [Deltaproteobacteria bacterium]
MNERSVINFGGYHIFFILNLSNFFREIKINHEISLMSNEVFIEDNSGVTKKLGPMLKPDNVERSVCRFLQL